MATPRLAGGRPVIRSPLMRISPRSGRSNPAMIRSNVDLPHPDGPTTTRNSPSGIFISMPERTGRRPKLLQIPTSSSEAMRRRSCSALERAGGEAGGDTTLKQQHDRDQGYGHDHRSGHDHAPGELVLAGSADQGNGDRNGAGAGVKG